MSGASLAKAYLDLCRISNLPTVWTNVLAASLLAAPDLQPAALLFPVLSLSLFYLAGMALNDLCDLEYDRVSRPARPIPSGRVGVTDAALFTVSLFALGFGALVLAPFPKAVIAAIVLLGTIVAYDRHHKKNPLSVLLMASCRFLVFIVAALAVSGTLPWPVVLAGGVQFGYIVLLSLVARHENGRPVPFPFPVIPLLLAGISLVDGLLLALLVGPAWLLAGAAGFLLTLAGQRYVRGD